jgi:hypothetical protein
VQKQNKAAFVLLGVNLVTLILLGSVNATIGQHGVFLYLPALFFLPGALCLDNSRGIPLAFVTGLLLDQQIETTFGFHAFALSTFHLLGSNWFRGVNYRKDLVTLALQLPANLLFFILWLLWIKIFENGKMEWTWGRWGIDLIASTLALIPLAIWIPRFAESLLGLTNLFPEGRKELS